MFKKFISVLLLIAFSNIFLCYPVCCKNSHVETTTGNVTVDKNEKLIFALIDPISTENINKEDEITAYITKDLFVGGDIAVPIGSLVYGKLDGSRPAKSFFRNGKIRITFYELETPDGQIIPIKTKKIKHASLIENLYKSIFECLLVDTVIIPFGLLTITVGYIEKLIPDLYYDPNKTSLESLFKELKPYFLYTGIDVELPSDEEMVIHLKKSFSIKPEEN